LKAYKRRILSIKYKIFHKAKVKVNSKKMTTQTIPSISQIANSISSNNQPANIADKLFIPTLQQWGQCQYTFKVVLQGLAGSGKSALFTRYFSDSFQREQRHCPTVRSQFGSNFVTSPLGN
jgi:hypothetical protein